MRELILASGSPRRRELLEQINIPFRVIVSGAEETVTETDPGETVKDLSMQKALWVAENVEEGLILGADTVVSIDGEILGKPKDREDAGRMLRKLQGRAHSVFTGVAIVRRNRTEDSPSGNGRIKAICRDSQAGIEILERFFRETKVFVHPMSDEEIEGYLDTGDAFDKAGSYGIQGPFAAFVDGIQGDYNNVVGLPVSAVYQALVRLGEYRK